MRCNRGASAQSSVVTDWRRLPPGLPDSRLFELKTVITLEIAAILPDRFGCSGTG